VVVLTIVRNDCVVLDDEEEEEDDDDDNDDELSSFVNCSDDECGVSGIGTGGNRELCHRLEPYTAVV
jgi:hypothetical protein